LINTLLGALIAAPAALPVIKFATGDLLDYLLIWLGVSIAMHAIPSTGDAKSLWQSVKGPGVSSVVRFMAAPIIGIIYLTALGRIFWLDLIYGIAVAVGIPTLLVAICSAPG
jgi:hypothetical protein